MNALKSPLSFRAKKLNRIFRYFLPTSLYVFQFEVFVFDMLLIIPYFLSSFLKQISHNVVCIILLTFLVTLLSIRYFNQTILFIKF
jgi:hypothetical protein